MDNILILQRTSLKTFKTVLLFGIYSNNPDKGVRTNLVHIGYIPDSTRNTLEWWGTFRLELIR